MPPEYDASRAAYALTRKPDPRIAAAIERALGDARSVVNVGAGAGGGAYESPEREVIAVEPAAAMGDQLPLAPDSVDAALAVLTLHHWDDQRRGLAELLRVARRRVVVFTYDPAEAGALWLVRDYLPEIAHYEKARFLPIAELVEILGGEGAVSVERVPIPHDCRDGFAGAFWRRPERYLDPATLPGDPAFTGIAATALERGLGKLRDDLASGVWRRNYGGLLSRAELDVGYRLVVATLA